MTTMQRFGFGFEAINRDDAVQHCAQQAAQAAAGGAVDVVANEPVYCQESNTWTVSYIGQVPASQYEDLVAHMAA